MSAFGLQLLMGHVLDDGVEGFHCSAQSPDLNSINGTTSNAD